MTPSSTKAQRIHNFFEKPESGTEKAVEVFIILLILLSVGAVLTEWRSETIAVQYATIFLWIEYVTLSIFTIEYALRVGTASRKLRYALKPMSIVDFMAIAPSYLELLLPFFIDASSARAVRILRLLKLSRLLRAFRLFRFGNLFNKIIRYEGTILQTITPVILVFVVSKSVVWLLESQGFWMDDPSLGELFAIIGFALGIILSQKIGVTYEKFLQVEEASVRLAGTLRSLTLILNKVEVGLGDRVCHSWAEAFLRILEDPKAENSAIEPYNVELYEAMSRAETTPAEMAVMHSEICKDAAFCLNKKIRLTPKAYDTLLHQVTMLYFTMIVIFIPGLTGMISVMLATYTLYGMYNLTEDLDSIIGGEFDLINIDITELENFVAEG